MDLRIHGGSIPPQVPTVSDWSSSAHVSMFVAPFKVNPVLHANVATVPISKGEVISIAYDNPPFIGAVRARHWITARKKSSFEISALKSLQDTKHYQKVSW